MQIQIVKKEKEIELAEQEALRKEKELEATIIKQADAEKYREEKRADASRYQEIKKLWHRQKLLRLWVQLRQKLIV